MTDHPSVPSMGPSPRPSLLRSAVWVAIGALIAAALVCVVWVLIGPQNAIIGRAFLTILLLTAFAGVAILDAQLAPRRPSWYVLASMVGWVVILLAGAFKIWLPMGDGFLSWDNPFTRILEFAGVVLVIRLALLHLVLYVKAHQRHVTTFTRILAIVTIVLVVALAILLVVPMTFSHDVTYPELYWRIVVAVTILAAVGTALVPLVNALNSPRTGAPAPAPGMPAAAPQLLQWPTYVDGATPLPVLPDGSPDWNAYYTGVPSPGAQIVAPVAPTPAEPYPPVQAWPAPSGHGASGYGTPGYESYPPAPEAPPLPPRPPLP